MVCICIVVCDICCVYFYTGKDRHRRSEFESCNSHQNHCSFNYGVGDGFFNKHTEWIIRNQPKKLDFFDFVRTATGASWLCYYKALQMGEASKVVPIDKLSVVITLVLAFVFLHEKFTIKSFLGCVFIGIGTLMMVL